MHRAPSSAGSKRRRSDSQSDSQSSVKRTRSNFSSHCKDKILKLAGWSCVHCGVRGVSVECAHLIGARAYETLSRLRELGLLHIDRLESPDNGIALCAQCHIAFDGSADMPNLVIVPSQLQFFFDAETAWQADPRGERAPTSHAYLDFCRKQPSTCPAYTGYMDQDFFAPGHPMRTSHFNWAGDPMAILHRAFVAVTQIAHPKLLSSEVFAQLFELQHLYRKGGKIYLDRETGHCQPDVEMPAPSSNSASQHPGSIHNPQTQSCAPSDQTPAESTPDFCSPNQLNHHAASGLSTPTSSPPAEHKWKCAGVGGFEDEQEQARSQKRRRTDTEELTIKNIQHELDQDRDIKMSTTESSLSYIPVSEDYTMRMFLETPPPDLSTLQPQSGPEFERPASCAAAGSDDDFDLSAITTRRSSSGPEALLQEKEVERIARPWFWHGGLTGTANTSLQIHCDRFYKHRTIKTHLEEWMMKGGEAFLTGLAARACSHKIEVG
jgi:hypothetical protein